jgi:hypothetical protein
VLHGLRVQEPLACQPQLPIDAAGSLDSGLLTWSYTSERCVLAKVNRKVCVCPKCKVLYIDQVLRLDFVLSRFFQGMLCMRLGEINALLTSAVIDSSIHLGGFSEFAVYC